MAKQIRLTVTWRESKTFDAIVPDETNEERDYHAIVWAYGHVLRDMACDDEYPIPLNVEGSLIIRGVLKSDESYDVVEDPNG